MGRAPGWLAGVGHRNRVPAATAAGDDPRRRARAMDRGHAVPARRQEDRARAQRGGRAQAGGRAGDPGRLRRLAGVAARVGARVRRRDRAGGRQLRGPDRVLRAISLSRRRVRRLLAESQSSPRDDRAQRGPGLSDRRRSGGGGCIRRRGRAGCGRRRADSDARRAGRAGRRCGAPAPASSQSGAVGRGARGEAPSVRGAVRPVPQHRAGRSNGVGQERHRAGFVARFPDRGGGARHPPDRRLPSSWTSTPPSWVRSSRRPAVGPDNRAALASASASSAVAASAVAAISPVQAGAPVAGSIRWWANSPSGRCHSRASMPDVATPPERTRSVWATAPVSG